LSWSRYKSWGRRYWQCVVIDIRCQFEERRVLSLVVEDCRRLEDRRRWPVASPSPAQTGIHICQHHLESINDIMPHDHTPGPLVFHVCTLTIAVLAFKPKCTGWIWLYVHHTSKSLSLPNTQLGNGSLCYMGYSSDPKSIRHPHLSVCRNRWPKDRSWLLSEIADTLLHGFVDVELGFFVNLSMTCVDQSSCWSLVACYPHLDAIELCRIWFIERSS
jgi:hypothetical protein